MYENLMLNNLRQVVYLCPPQVYDVEQEMRQLLEETETTKRIMEEKMKRLTSVLKDF